MTPEQRAALTARLAQPDLADLGDEAASAALRHPDAALGTKSVNVVPEDLREVLFAADEWPAILLIADGMVMPGMEGLPPQQALQLRGLCISTREILTRTKLLQTHLPPYRAKIEAALGGLLQAGIIGAVSRDAIVALMTRDLTWGEANGFPDDGPTTRDVGLARGAEGGEG